MKHPKILLFFISTLFGFNTQIVSANEVSPWMVRFRVQHVSPATESIVVPVIAGPNATQLNKKTQPEIDVSYFFTPNLAAELAFTRPERYLIKRDDFGELGSFKYSSPILSLQYHMNTQGDFKPYIGLGVSRPQFSDGVLFSTGGSPVSIGGRYTKPVIGVGFDYRICQNLHLNVDAKKSSVRGDVVSNADPTHASSLKFNPIIVSVGLGFKF